MDHQELWYILYVIAGLLVTVGSFYAWQIKMSPSPHGWTFVSVAVGDGFVDIALGFGIFVALILLYGLEGALRGWWLTVFPVTAHLLAGVPMIIGQLLKWQDDHKRASERLRGK